MATNAEMRAIVTAALSRRRRLWLFIFLVLPFIAMLVFAFGERAPEGGYQAAFTFAAVRQSAVARAAFWNTLMLAPVGCLALPVRRLSRRLLSRGQGEPALPADPCLAGRRAVLDEPAGAHLCLDVSCWARAAFPICSA